MATQPSLRIGDREREYVAKELQEHFAHGRLTIEELNARLDATFAAKTQADLSQITADLPHIRPAGPPLPSGGGMAGPPLLVSEMREGRPGYGMHPGDWSGTAWSGRDWPAAGWADGNSSDGRQRRRGGIGGFATLIAALASWLLVYDVILVGLRWPFAGRIGLLLAVFAVIRGLVRRIFGVSHGRCFRRW